LLIALTPGPGAMSRGLPPLRGRGVQVWVSARSDAQERIPTFAKSIWFMDRSSVPQPYQEPPKNREKQGDKEQAPQQQW
jgi:hypothetical protein